MSSGKNARQTQVGPHVWDGMQTISEIILPLFLTCFTGLGAQVLLSATSCQSRLDRCTESQAAQVKSKHARPLYEQLLQRRWRYSLQHRCLAMFECIPHLVIPVTFCVCIGSKVEQLLVLFASNCTLKICYDESSPKFHSTSGHVVAKCYKLVQSANVVEYVGIQTCKGLSRPLR